MRSFAEPRKDQRGVIDTKDLFFARLGGTSVFAPERSQDNRYRENCRVSEAYAIGHYSEHAFDGVDAVKQELKDAEQRVSDDVAEVVCDESHLQRSDSEGSAARPK